MPPRINRPVRPARKPARAVPARGCPPVAEHAMVQAYLLVLREVHSELVGSAAIQDAAAVRKGWLARALAWVTKATSTIKSSVDEDLHTLPTVAGARLAGTQELVLQFRTRNVNLIKTVAADHVKTVDRVVRENSGTHVKGLTAKLQESLDISESKAKFWAVDQTLKLHADIVQTQHERLGIEEYDWITSKDGTVRDDHAKLEGKRFRYDTPPITNASQVAKGQAPRRCNPGKDYRCRCHADPVLPTAESMRAKQQAVAPVQPQPAPQPALQPAAQVTRVSLTSGHANVLDGNAKTTRAILSGIDEKQALYLAKKPIKKLEITAGKAVVRGDTVEGFYFGGDVDHLIISGEGINYGDPWVPGKVYGVSDAAASEAEAAQAVFYHELGHRIGAKYTAEIREVFIKPPYNRISEYAGTTFGEYFSECYCAYMTHRDDLRLFDQAGFDLVERILTAEGLL